VTGSRRTIGWIVLGALAAAFLVFAVVGDRSARTNEDRANVLATRFACPVCDGQSVRESDALIAREIRKEIATRIDKGQTDGQIRDYIVSRYGESVDLTPASTGVAGLVWILPVVAFIAGAAGLTALFIGWNRRPARRATDADRELVDQARRGTP
jgi:cytochrome c-type biogenesis protein CcmH